MLSQCKINSRVRGTHTQRLIEINSQTLKEGVREQAGTTDTMMFTHRDIQSKPTEIASYSLTF